MCSSQLTLSMGNSQLLQMKMHSTPLRYSSSAALPDGNLSANERSSILESGVSQSSSRRGSEKWGA